MNATSFWLTPQTQSVRGCEKGVVAMHWDTRCSYRLLKCNHVKTSLDTTPGRGKCSLSDHKGAPTGTVGKGKRDIGDGEGGNTSRHTCHAHFLAISLTYDFFSLLFFPLFSILDNFQKKPVAYHRNQPF